MCKRHSLIALALLFSQASMAATPLGEINIELRGNVVDFSCTVESADSNKTVGLGTWPTKQLRTPGSTTALVPFKLKLTGCPPGSASITFSGTPASEPSLLALRDSEMAKTVAIELRDSDRSRITLGSASQQAVIDENGDVTLQFYANYIALAQNATPGDANADATFTINYE
jgi:minor fimbrial subunit